MAIAALLILEDDGAFPFEWSSVVKIGCGNGIASPCIHDRTPWRVHAEAGEHTECDGDDGNHENGHRTARPVLSICSLTGPSRGASLTTAFRSGGIALDSAC